jgi:negative regulator of flagellin synthesis FlgM
MQVYGPAHLHGAQPVGPPHAARLTGAAPASSAPIQDELSLSSAGLDASRMVDQVREMPDVRQDKVASIRAQIANGTYETDEKLQVALGRLMDEMG